MLPTLSGDLQTQLVRCVDGDGSELLLLAERLEIRVAKLLESLRRHDVTCHGGHCLCVPVHERRHLTACSFE